MFGTADERTAALVEALGDPDRLLMEGRPLRQLAPRLLRGFGVAAGQRLQRLSFVEWFFVRALVSSTVSRGYAPAPPPHLSYTTWQKLKLIWAAQVLSGNLQALATSYSALLDRIERETASDPEPVDIEVPRLRAADLDPVDFTARFLEQPMPVVLEGFATDTVAAKAWNAEYFRERYGEQKVVIRMQRVEGSSGGAADEDRIGTLADVADDIFRGESEDGRRRYIHNMKNIFNWHPELLADLDLYKLRPFVGKKTKYGGSHLFFGGKKTGTGFHCARSLNFFFMVEGEKSWTLVHPEHTPFMYPILNTYVASVASPIGNPKFADRDFTLYRRIPKYRAHLKPGDVLMNPPWWWHEVQNLTPSTIAVATRWFGDMQARAGNVLFDALQTTRLWTLWHEAKVHAGLRLDALPGDAFLVPRRSY